MTVALQDTYMQNAKILLVSGENIEDFHVAGPVSYTHLDVYKRQQQNFEE